MAVASILYYGKNSFLSFEAGATCAPAFFFYLKQEVFILPPYSFRFNQLLFWSAVYVPTSRFFLFKGKKGPHH